MCLNFHFRLILSNEQQPNYIHDRCPYSFSCVCVCMCVYAQLYHEYFKKLTEVNKQRLSLKKIKKKVFTFTAHEHCNSSEECG